jgi:transposase
VFNLREGGWTGSRVTARHLKAVPGRTTEVRECEGWAELLRPGGLQASFIAPAELRELGEWRR